MATVDINYKITGLESLIESLQSLASKFESLGTKLDNINSNGSDKSSDKGDSAKATADAEDPMAALAAAMSNTAQGQKTLAAKMDELKTVLSKMTDNLKKNEDGKDERKTSGYSRLTRGLILAAGAAATYEAGSFGATAGSSQGSLNAGVLHYTEFQKEFRNRQLSNTQTAVSTGTIVATSLIANQLLKGGAIGAVLAAGVLAGGAAINYFTNETTERKKLANEQLRQDPFSWRLNNLGISGLSDTTILGNSSNAGIRLTELQKRSLSPEYAGYDATLSDSIFGGRRDVIKGMSNNQLLEYNKNLTDLSRLTGNDDIAGLSRAATGAAAMTGMDANDIVKKMIEDTARFGGDTAANTAKVVQLLQSTSLSPNEAREAVNRYQYNDPMLQNIIAGATNDPLTRFSSSVIGKAAGLSEDEISSLTLSPAHLDYYKKSLSKNPMDLDVQSVLYGKFYEAQHKNILANNLGDIFGGPESSIGSRKPTATIQETMDSIKESLKYIKIDSQSVNATNVYLNGNVKESGSNTSGKKPPSAGMPTTGVSDDASASVKMTPAQASAWSDYQTELRKQGR